MDEKLGKQREEQDGRQENTDEHCHPTSVWALFTRPLVIIHFLRPIAQAAKAFGRVEAFGTVAVAVDAHIATACTPSIGQLTRTLNNLI